MTDEIAATTDASLVAPVEAPATIEAPQPVEVEPSVVADLNDARKDAENEIHSFFERIAEKLGGDLELAKTWLEDKIAAL